MLVFFWNYYVEVAEEDNAKKYQAFFLATYKTTAQAHGERRREQEQPNFTAIPSTTPGRLSTWESPFLKTCVGTPTSWTWSTKPTRPSTSCDGHWRSGPFTPKIRRTKHLSAQFWNTLAVSGTRTPPRTSAKLRLCSEGRQGGVVNPIDRPPVWVKRTTSWRGPHWMNADEGHASPPSSNSTGEKWWSTSPGSPLTSPPTRPTCSTHQEAYLLPACRTQYRQKSFFPRTIVEWNALPPVAIQSATVEAKNLRYIK